jgi:hypothetical protein
MTVESPNAVFSFYDKTTGIFSGRTFFGPREYLAINTPSGHASIEGEHDHLSRRIDIERFHRDREAALEAHRAHRPEVDPAFEFRATAAHVIDWQPEQPSADHEWNTDTRRWQLSATASGRIARRQSALGRIRELERQQARPMRELAIDAGNAEARKRLEAIEAEIASLRGAARPL